MVVGDVLAQFGCFARGHAAGAIATVLPNLELVIGAEADGLFAIGRSALEILLGEGAAPHSGELGKLLKDRFTGWAMGLRIHRRE